MMIRPLPVFPRSEPGGKDPSEETFKKTRRPLAALELSVWHFFFRWGTSLQATV